jgi:hypothetical protein
MDRTPRGQGVCQMESRLLHLIEELADVHVTTKQVHVAMESPEARDVPGNETGAAAEVGERGG